MRGQKVNSKHKYMYRMSEDNLCFEKIELLIRRIGSAEMVPVKGEVLNEVRTCLLEKVTFEGVEGTTCVELP